MLDPAPDEIAKLMAAFRAGDNRAGGQLMELFYPELKRLAAWHLLRQPRMRSWQPTLLVNELYLQLIRSKALTAPDGGGDQDKAAFFSLASLIMKRLLIYHCRPLSRKAEKIPLSEEVRVEEDASLVEVEELLARLEDIKPAIRTVVELRVFEGMTAEEIAPKLGCSVVTVHRYWQFARRWMRNEWKN